MKCFNQSLLVVACVLLLAGCGGPPSSVTFVYNHKAQARKQSNGCYEVKISRSIIFRRPLFRRPLPQFPFLSYSKTSHQTYWFYLARTNGTVDGSDVVVMDSLGHGDLAVEGMKGTICFSNGTMTVNLKQPFRPDGVHIQGYGRFSQNGTYQLE